MRLQRRFGRGVGLVQIEVKTVRTQFEVVGREFQDGRVIRADGGDDAPGCHEGGPARVTVRPS